MRTRVCGLIVAVAVLVLSAGLVWAQNPIELQLDDQPLGEAMRSLQQAYGVQYNLPADLAKTKVTVHQTVNSPAAAVQALARAANVRALQDPSLPGAGRGGHGNRRRHLLRNRYHAQPVGNHSDRSSADPVASRRRYGAGRDRSRWHENAGYAGSRRYGGHAGYLCHAVWDHAT